MNVNDFVDRLENISTAYSWDVNQNRVVAKIKSGPHKGHELNPVTALAHKHGFGFFDNNREDTVYAASLLGLSRKYARTIYSATIGTHNRGNSQVVRGKIRSALEV
tara:strand:+ start:8540 stop:8857 length:318 start_codon:yes stop_codon:yes gene_type:complete